VFIFAVCEVISFHFGSFFICMFLAFGFIMMTASFAYESESDSKVAAIIAMAFSCVYAVLVLVVYFAQTTVVHLNLLNEREAVFLDFSRSGLIFYYDLLGYGLMALSTFFIGLSVKVKDKADKWLKVLLMIHGVFFLGCFFMPILGVFKPVEAGEMGIGGTIALIIWCIYFLPIGVLAYRHFSKSENN
jgi:hypothetical protein